MRQDATLWLNLGSSYFGSGKGGGGSYALDGMTVSAGVRVDSGGSYPSQSPLLWRAPAYDSDDTKSPNSPGADRACPGYDDARPDATASRHADTPRNGRRARQGEPPILPTGHDSEPAGCGRVPHAALPPDVPESTTPLSCDRPSDVCGHEATASVSRRQPTTSLDGAPPSADNLVYTYGTPPTPPPLIVRTVGRESFFSACQSPDCKGVGRCGLCWCRLAIPSLHVKSKDLVSVPNLVALALQADGWWLRSEIVWAKPNPMPESVTDRPTSAHEKIFLLSKSARYWYDAEAVREPAEYGRRNGPTFSYVQRADTRDARNPSPGTISGGDPSTGRNLRNVWTFATEPFPEAHFATFPTELVRRCILAGCPIGGTVLDPFGGSGTVGLVADRLQRSAILIEAKADYVEMAKRRISMDAPLLELAK